MKQIKRNIFFLQKGGYENKRSEIDVYVWMWWTEFYDENVEGKAVGQNRTKNCGRESVLIDCLNLIWIKISKNGIKFLIAVLFLN